MESKENLEDIEYIKKHLDSIEQELKQLRKMTIYRKHIDSIKVQKAWEEFINLADEVSERWEGLSAKDEIRSQREK